MVEAAGELIERICDRFLLAQEATGLSKKAFAEAVGLTAPQLSNIKNYRNPPPHFAIHKATQEFGFTADWFYNGSRAGFRDAGLAEKLRAAEGRKSSAATTADVPP